MYEFQSPHLRKEAAGWGEILTSENARYPLILCVVLGTAFY